MLKIFNRNSLFFASILLVLSLAMPTDGSAQGEKFPLLWFEINAGIGSPKLLNPTLRCVLQQRHEISLGYGAVARRGHEVPGDYESKKLIEPFGAPQGFLVGFTPSYGYVFSTKWHPRTIRFVARAGFLIGRLSLPKEFYNMPRSSSENYGFYRRDKTSIAMIINPTMQLTAMPKFGFSIGLYGVVGREVTGAGLNLSLMFGHVTKRVVDKPREKH